MENRMRISVDGIAYQSGGEGSLAAFLLNANLPMRQSVRGEERRGFCAMGHCGECRVHLHGGGVVLACMTPLSDGMVISHHG